MKNIGFSMKTHMIFHELNDPSIWGTLTPTWVFHPRSPFRATPVAEAWPPVGWSQPPR